ncbi:MAG: competence/damage-inducible protein A [Cytophagales bacterium]|nr:competence/damage-inducible protein A [Cytophagales bacterium]
MEKQVTAEIISIGDEILIGQILNTNAQWMGNALHKIGISTSFITTIGDDAQTIFDTLKIAENRVDIILITGGLGPTKDDITKKVLAKYFDSEMIMNQEVLEHVTKLFESRGREISEINKLQALVPEKCEVLKNSLGTAPCMCFVKDNKVFVSMPGVPFEMKNIMQEEVLPKLTNFFQTPYIQHRVIQTIGMGESTLAEIIADWENELYQNDVSLAYLPSPGMVKLRLSMKHPDENHVDSTLKRLGDQLYDLVPEYIFGEGDDISIEQIVGEILTEKGINIATAESCTGGYIAHLLTSISGSSTYFKGSMIAYSNEIKIKELNVSADTLKREGAVSQEVVIQMAENIRKKYNTSIGVSCSGIAGPNGGTLEKPVGTVWIAYSDEDKTISTRLQLTKKRDLNIRLTAIAILNLVRKELTLVNY